MYIAIKIKKKKKENKPDRLGKYWNINPKSSKRFLYLHNESNPI